MLQSFRRALHSLWQKFISSFKSHLAGLALLQSAHLDSRVVQDLLRQYGVIGGSSGEHQAEEGTQGVANSGTHKDEERLA